MGFTENASRATGVEKLWADMRRYSSRGVVVLTPREWRDDMDALASFISRNSNCEAAVLVVAYSWGCGVGFRRFAQAAWVLGFPVVCACLADPVYRSPILPSWLPLNPLSLTRVPRLGVPASVRNVRWVRQSTDIPAGHDLYAEDPGMTCIDPPLWCECGHRTIDDSPAFKRIVLEAVEEFAQATTEVRSEKAEVRSEDAGRENCRRQK